ncbi:NUDIX hydrolase [Pedobacter metabolipauper]|uniref:NUDIX domain-containing protein n=1 Tax=Pedobacter metabolipauper TaxID=425513 RepID=A0A4R6SXU5_9SPHI|nr:NUDIX domain-containing protein [Pedobacter metabolipauper]TDQ10286.1 NUDIX domain-containing protein [Pedobacter metabolipauper]
MSNSRNIEFKKDIENYLPAISVDLVIFGFHDNDLKILLLELKDKENWALPGGFIFKDEFLEDAAKRVLQERTGLTGIFLEQFHVFGDPERTRMNNREKQLVKQLENVENVESVESVENVEDDKLSAEIRQWLLGRFVTVGFYALVEYTEVNPKSDFYSIQCTWCDISSLPPLVSDHQKIIEKALQTLRLHLNFHPIGLNLLPKEFTMPELQRLYETILGIKLDRRNFQRRIINYNILTRLSKKRTGGAFKAPYLYQFDEALYQKALQNGLDSPW